MSRPIDQVLSRLSDVHETTNGWIATCPAHNDGTPSLSIDEGRNGRVLLNCFAGCDYESIISALRLEPADLFPDSAATTSGPGYTLEAYAADKALPVDFLRELGVHTHKLPGKPPCLAIPYCDENGNPVTERFRTAERFWWPKGTEMKPYGIDRLPATGSGPAVVLVEGESDAMTLWLHGSSALGIPGANAWRSSWKEYLRERRVFVWMEPDAGGQAFVRGLSRDLPNLLVVRPPDGLKDVSDLHLRDPDGFSEALAEVLKSAIPVSDLTEARQEPAAVRRAQLVLLSEVTPERLRWLWPGRIPLGKLTLLDGDPGLGKSTLALDVAARVSNGAAMPDEADSDLDGPAGAVLLTAEDGLADTVRPRLDAAGADCSRIVALRSVLDADGEDRWPDVRNTEAIENAMALVDARLIVIDPLVAYLGSADSHRDQQVRGALADLADLADRTGAAVIAIRHLRKSSSEQALYRGGGSIGLIAAARAAHLIAPDPAHPDEYRILAPLKMNLARPAPALRFVLHQVGGVARIVWEGEASYSAEDLLAPAGPQDRPALDEAMEFLRGELAEGPRAASELINEAKRLGIKTATLRRAKAEVKAKALKQGFGEGWVWELTGEKAD